jgi:tRNA(adenine34) deaminase
MKPLLADIDRTMMARAIAFSRAGSRQGEYPFGCVVAEGDRVVAEAVNHSRREGDVSRHAEIVALAQAHKALGRRKLRGCTLYTTVEPCPMCAFCVREAGIGRVVYAIGSPVMGGLSRWNILRDDGLSGALPEVFGPAPEIVGGFMQEEAEQAWKDWNPIAWPFIRTRGLLGGAQIFQPRRPARASALWARLRTRLASLV